MTEEILITLKDAIFTLNTGVRSTALSRHPTVQQQLTKMCSEAHMFMSLEHVFQGIDRIHNRLDAP